MKTEITIKKTWEMPMLLSLQEKNTAGGTVFLATEGYTIHCCATRALNGTAS